MVALWENKGDKMKKITMLAALIITAAVLFSGCGTASTTAASSKWSDITGGKGAKVPESMSALVSEMQDKGYINDEATVTEMSPVKQKNSDGETKKYGGYLEIGAAEGYRFAFDYNSSNVNLELYRYDGKNPGEGAESVINSVKKDGVFTVSDSDKKIKAYLSADENFLMIYQDSSPEKKNKNKMNSAVKYFEEYKAGK